MSDNSNTRTPGYKLAWKDRPPQRIRPRTITIKGDVFAALDAIRGAVPWSQFLARLAGLPPSRDRRLNVEK